MHLFETKFMRQKLRGHRGYLRIPCCCRSVVLIGLPKVKFLVWASGGSDKNRERETNDRRSGRREERGIYSAQLGATNFGAPRSAAPSLGPCRMPGWPGDCACVAPRRRDLWRRDVLARRHSLRRRPPGPFVQKVTKRAYM